MTLSPYKVGGGNCARVHFGALHIYLELVAILWKMLQNRQVTVFSCVDTPKKHEAAISLTWLHKCNAFLLTTCSPLCSTTSIVNWVWSCHKCPLKLSLGTKWIEHTLDFPCPLKVLILCAICSTWPWETWIQVTCSDRHVSHQEGELSSWPSWVCKMRQIITYSRKL